MSHWQRMPSLSRQRGPRRKSGQPQSSHFQSGEHGGHPHRHQLTMGNMDAVKFKTGFHINQTWGGEDNLKTSIK